MFGYFSINVIMKKKILTLIVGVAGTIGAYAQSIEAQNALNNENKQFFIENKGQWPEEVLYATHIGGLDAWITKNGVLYDFYKLEEEPSINKNQETVLADKFEHKKYTKYGHRVWYKLKGNNTNVKTEGKGKQKAYYNYLIGNDPNKHASNVSLYREAIVRNVYNGIDARYYFDKGSIRYDFVVHPGAEPSQINFTLEGTDHTLLDQDGNLVFNTRFGEVVLAELHTYQNTKDNMITSRFVKTENVWGISVGDYDINQILIIDPLIYSTYLGGNKIDYVSDIDIDASGNAYVTGGTTSTNFITTTGAYQTSPEASWEIFVTKFNASGSAVIYSTFLGGNSTDWGFSIKVDVSSNVYVTGMTSSTNYDITSGAFQTSFTGVVPGYHDVFVTKLNSTGSGLIYSTYLGGSADDRGLSIVLDASDNAYITGVTKSTNFDVTLGAYQTNNGGSEDVFVTKLNATGSSLIYSTYLGGSSDDYGTSIAIDASNNIYVTGTTTSANYDITAGAYQTSNGGLKDLIVTKLNTTGSALIYSTYLGGSNDDIGGSIAVDAVGNSYVAGYSLSTNYDITPGAYQTNNGGMSDGIVTKLNPSGSALVYSTYLGGDSTEYGGSIAVDAVGNSYVTGATKSTNYDTTAAAYQTINEGFEDVFVTKLNTTGSALTYSTYLGGSWNDQGYSIAIDTSDIAYITGRTSSTNYDTTTGAYQTTYGDIFVTKICLGAEAIIDLSSNASTDSQNVCINSVIDSIIYTTINASGAIVTGLPAGVSGSLAANVFTISGTPSESGTFNYIVTTIGDCNLIVTTGSITVGCVGIDDQIKAQGILLFPNPANTEVRIKVDFIDPIQIEIIDASGKIIQVDISHDSRGINIDVSKFANGLYGIRLVCTGEVYFGKIMVQH